MSQCHVQVNILQWKWTRSLKPFIACVIATSTKTASSLTANTVTSVTSVPGELCLALFRRSLPFFSPLLLNQAINTACVVPPAAPPFASALVLQPGDWDIFIPVLCTSQAPSIILLKSAPGWKWKGLLQGGVAGGTVDGFSMAHSICLPPSSPAVLPHFWTWPSATQFIVLCCVDIGRARQQHTGTQPWCPAAAVDRLQPVYLSVLLTKHQWAVLVVNQRKRAEKLTQAVDGKHKMHDEI